MIPRSRREGQTRSDRLARTAHLQGLLLRVAILALIVSAPLPARAGFFDTYGVDARGMALGGAVTATARGWSAVHYNPAALALSRDISLSMGMYWATPNIKTDYVDGPDRDLVELPRRDRTLGSIAGPSFGVVMPIQKLTPRRLGIPVAIGAGVFVPRQSLATVRAIEQTFPFDVVFQERNETLELNVGISTRITPAVYLGLGLAAQMASSVEYQITETSANFAELKTRFGTPAFIGGILVRPWERVRLGLVYRQKKEVKSQWSTFVQTRISFSFGQRPDQQISFFKEQTFVRKYISGFTPENISFGGAYRITERLQVSLDLTWYRWSSYPGPLDQGLAYAFNDIVVPRLGVAYRITRNLEARAGFFYEPTPVTNQGAGFYPIGNDRFVPSLGLGYVWTVPWGLLAEPISIDAYFQYHILAEETFDRAVPVTPVTQNPDLTSSGSVFNLGLDLTFHF